MFLFLLSSRFLHLSINISSNAEINGIAKWFNLLLNGEKISIDLLVGCDHFHANWFLNWSKTIISRVKKNIINLFIFLESVFKHFNRHFKTFRLKCSFQMRRDDFFITTIIFSQCDILLYIAAENERKLVIVISIKCWLYKWRWKKNHSKDNNKWINIKST